MEITENRGGEGGRDLHIWTGTWNVQSNSVSSADRLDAWIGKAPRAPDIVAVALQEMVELSAQSVFKWADGAPQAKVDSFTWSFEAAMRRVWDTEYRMIRSVGMVGQFIAIYVISPLYHNIAEVDSDRVKSGVDGIFGNKGAVCVRFRVAGHGTISFCNVHLASGVEKTEERKANLRQLFLEAFQGTSLRGHIRKPKNGYNRAGVYKPHLHDASFVLGDFNFRLIPGDGDLLSRDQFLCKVSADPWIYSHYAECQIAFPPSYKYIVGSKEFNKKRAPAWCDRILFGNSGHVHPLVYDSVPEMMYTSDHRAVMGSFLWSREARGRNQLRSHTRTRTEPTNERFDRDLQLAIKMSEKSFRKEERKRANTRDGHRDAKSSSPDRSRSPESDKARYLSDVDAHVANARKVKTRDVPLKKRDGPLRLLSPAGGPTRSKRKGTAGRDISADRETDAITDEQSGGARSSGAVLTGTVVAASASRPVIVGKCVAPSDAYVSSPSAHGVSLIDLDVSEPVQDASAPSADVPAPCAEVSAPSADVPTPCADVPARLDVPSAREMLVPSAQDIIWPTAHDGSSPSQEGTFSVKEPIAPEVPKVTLTVRRASAPESLASTVSLPPNSSEIPPYAPSAAESAAPSSSSLAETVVAKESGSPLRAEAVSLSPVGRGGGPRVRGKVTGRVVQGRVVDRITNSPVGRLSAAETSPSYRSPVSPVSAHTAPSSFFDCDSPKDTE